MSKLNINIGMQKLLVFLVLTISSIIIAFINLGFDTGFWITAFLWIIIYLVFFVKPAIKIVSIFWVIITMTFTFSMLISFKVILTNDDDGIVSISKNVEKSADGIVLATCTSTANDKPVALAGWRSTIYSAPLSKTTSPDADKANNVRTFSYSAIKNKTDKNSIYSRVEKSDGSYITGFGTTIEACSADNKTTKSYTTADTNYVASDDVVASTHYLHGGNYLHGTSDYRIDVYVKTLDGKWHLIDRMSSIKVTK